MELILKVKKIDAKYIVNPAGLYTDKIAQDFSFSQEFGIIN